MELKYTPPEKERSGGWKVSEPYREMKQEKWFKEMLAETLAENRPPKPVVPTHFNGKPVSELDVGEKEAFIFSLQAKSTQEALTAQKTRRPEDDLEHVLRPMNPDYLAVKDAKSLDELVPRRDIDPQAYDSYKSMQRSEKNTKGTKGLGIGEEAKRRAVEAFTYSRPAEPSLADLKRLKKITPLDAVVATEASEPKPLETPGAWYRAKKRLRRLLPFLFYQGEAYTDPEDRHGNGT
jgi:hypothetical protein